MKDEFPVDSVEKALASLMEARIKDENASTYTYWDEGNDVIVTISEYEGGKTPAMYIEELKAEIKKLRAEKQIRSDQVGVTTHALCQLLQHLGVGGLDIKDRHVGQLCDAAREYVKWSAAMSGKMEELEIPLSQIAALADCIEAVDLGKVHRYREVLDDVPPISVCQKNSKGFYVLEDGNHRTMAALLEGKESIRAITTKPPMELSWRWPRIAPVVTTFELMRDCHPSPAGPPADAEPVGWVYELALDNQYTRWAQPKFTFYKPSVPDGAIRNLKPVYDHPACANNTSTQTTRECPKGGEHTWIIDYKEEDKVFCRKCFVLKQ